ncbi:MAG: UPF0262 family protein [Brevundimonas sp.]
MSDVAHRLSAIELGQATQPSPPAQIEHERRVAIFDLVEKNHFAPVGGGGGPYALKLSLQDSRLVFDITGPGFGKLHALSLTPFKAVVRDYIAICDSYYEALRGSSPSQIEAVDMGRRGLHNEGAELLRERLDGKIELDLETSRRLFTLITALHRRG